MGTKISADAHEIFSFDWNFDLTALANGNTEDAHVLVVISKKEANDKFIVNNVIRCNFNDSVDYEYAK